MAPSPSSPFLHLLLRQHSKSLTPLPAALTFQLRHMGGGPRTFPGGLSKWKYRRMHEKLARDKERRLLQQEKDLYQARLRSELRSHLASFSDSSAGPPSHLPMSSVQHLKALADRFMKPGADDLWNDDDGPLHTSAAPGPSPHPRAQLPDSRAPGPLDLRRMVSERRSSDWRQVESFYQRREYSVVARRRLWRGSGTDSDSDSGYSFEKDMCVSAGGEKEGERGGKKMGGWGVLGVCDKKKSKRVPAHLLEKITTKQEVQRIREELEKRRMGEGATDKEEKVESSIFTHKRFDECNLSPLTIKALSSANYEKMTVVQAAAIPFCLDGRDALIRAKSGAGKSMIYLLPIIEAVLKATSVRRNKKVHPILALILCPTRELASQITAEANVLLRYHAGIGVQTLIGGTRFKVDQKRLESNPSQIIVATPGRLLDHIENKSGFSARIMDLKVIVIDEANHLLGLGFRSDIEKIVDCIPRQRQSLMFSAAIPKEVRRIAQLVLKKDHILVDTISSGCLEIHSKVPLSYIVSPHENHFEVVHHLLAEHIVQNLEYKVIVSSTTDMVAALMYRFLQNMNMNVREIHFRKSELYSTQISCEFQNSKRLILVTPDISVHGINCPDVTLVIQVGMPCEREEFIQRLREFSEDENRKAILLLAPWEEYLTDQLKNLPMKKSFLPEFDAEKKLKVEASMEKIDTGTKEAAYHAWLGHYNSISEIARDKTTLVEHANKFCSSMGLQRPPALSRKAASRMGLSNISGIRLK